MRALRPRAERPRPCRRRARCRRVVVFPELSLTGYELDAAAVACTDDVLGPIVEACAATGSIALAGAPIGDGPGREHIATLRIDADGVRVAYRKLWLGDAERARFIPGTEPVALEVDGWRLGLGICKDTGIVEHADATAALGIDVYLAGVVHLPEELGEQDARGLRIARQTGAHVAFASCAAPTGGGYHATADHSTVWLPAGTVLARTGGRIGEIAVATIGRDA